MLELKRSTSDIARNCTTLASQLASLRQAEADDAKAFAKSIASAAADVKSGTASKTWSRMENTLKRAIAEFGYGNGILDVL